MSSERADQLVLEYLGRANDFAYRHLGAAERLDFMTRLRTRIEEHRVAAAALAVTTGGFGPLGDDLRTGDAPLPLRLAGPAGALYLGWRLLQATGVKTVRITRARGRG